MKNNCATYTKQTLNFREMAKHFNPQERSAVLHYLDQLDDLNMALSAKEQATAEVMDLTEDECAEVLKYYHTMSRSESEK